MDEAVEWLKRAPFDAGAEIEIREIEADFDDMQEWTERARVGARGSKA
jgi:hypothetical protein